jgi:hypothetical protein
MSLRDSLRFKADVAKGMQAVDSFRLRLDQHEEAMTVKELHTFTPIELDVITDALKIADAHYRMLAELTERHAGFRSSFEHQARDAASLQLKIEASK